MIIAERNLEIRRKRRNAQLVPVRSYAPVAADGNRSCTFEVDWPEGQRRMAVYGVDAMQALELTLRCIGSELDGSEQHERCELVWLEPGDGYGFPVVSNLKDLLVGHGKMFFDER
jgi:hypothetical protein